jgi:chromosome segregation ATPase
MSAEMLNALIEAYLAYRADIHTDTLTDDLRDQRERFEQDLAEADQAIRAYLESNNLTDLAAERDTLRALYQSASGELLVAQSRLRQAEARLDNYRIQIELIAPELDIYVEDSSQQTLLALQLERREKLSRYREESRVIQELDKRIEQAESYLDTRAGTGGIVRRGPNPLYQQVEAAIATLQSEVQWLKRHCRQLFWLNPLLRFDGYAPLASGAQVLHQHADGMLAVHNLSKLEDLAQAISKLMKRSSTSPILF